MNKHRFNQLMEKYRWNNLSSDEYQEFLHLLAHPEVEKDLESLLTHYWRQPDKSIIKNRSLTKKYQKQSRVHYYFKWSVAASVAFAIGLLAYLWVGSPLIGSSYALYETGFGERMDIELNDGSKITLNANSELKWAEDWEKSKTRQIFLKGEAFFEVKKQNGIPFTVLTDDVEVEVLGTSFNVDSRQEKTEVYLDEGKVYLKLKKNRSEQNEEEAIFMKPGDQVRYIAKEKKVERSEGQSIATAASWKNNILNFKNMSFSEVLEMLRDLYGQSFECNNTDLLSTPMYLSGPYTDWDGVRQALELSLGIRFELKAPRRYEVRKIKK